MTGFTRVHRIHHKPLAIVLVLLLLGPGPFLFLRRSPDLQSLYAQVASNDGNENDEEDDQRSPPLPYERDEFPDWGWDLRRGEIIAFGAFPIAMILSGIGLQLGRFAIKSAESGEFSQEYAPFFFSTEPGPRYNQNERTGLLISAGVISVGIALIDYFLGRRERARR